MANWDWLKNSSQWLNDNQGRFSATMSDLAGIVAPQNPFAASGLGRKLSERNVYAKALQEKQGDQDDARRLLQGILSGKVKPSPREQPGFTGLSLTPGKGGETFLKTEYTLSGAEDPDKAPTQGQSSLANRPVPPASSSDLPWDMTIGPSGTPDFSYRDPEMQGRIPPPEAVQQMLALREQGQQPRRPRVVNTQGQPVGTPQRSDFNPAELGILPTEKQAQLAQMGRYGDELGLALAKLMGDRDYQQQRLAMDWVQLNRPGKPAPPPEPELYYDAEGNPSWHLPGDQNIPQGTYPVGKVPKTPEEPELYYDAEGNPSWYLPGDPNIPKGTYPVGKRPKTPEEPAPPPEEPELYYDAEGNPSWHLPGDPNIPQGTYPVGKRPKTPKAPPPPPEPELYYDADGNPSWYLPGDPNIPQGTYPVGKMPKTPEEPDAPITTLDPAKQEQYRQSFYNMLSSAMTEGQVPTGQQDRRGDPVMRPIDEQAANQLTEMSMNMGRGRFYAYEEQGGSGWFSGKEGPLDFFPNKGTPTLVEYRIAPEYADQLPNIREAAKFDGWPKAISEMKARGVLIPVETGNE